MPAIEHTGTWWLPENPTATLHGTVRIEPGASPMLRLTGALPEPLMGHAVVRVLEKLRTLIGQNEQIGWFASQ
jgi:hypothetical protein